MDLKRSARLFYQRKDIQKAIADHAQNREVVPRYGEGFGKRPDIIEYPGDVAALAEKGVTSFHFSEELWHNPLDLTTALTPEKLNELRKGWDLILDVDSKFLGFSKISAELILGALKFHNVQNVGLKFSGRAGWHIFVPFGAFPSEIQGIPVKNMFPQGPRMIAGYLGELIEKSLRDRILETTTPQELSERTKKPVEDFYFKDKFNPFSVVDIDTIAISPRHLIRMPYSLNEKSGFSSIVIRHNQLKNFHLGWAQPSRVSPKPFFPTPEKNEAKELMLEAFDWNKIQDSKKKVGQLNIGNPKRKYNPITIKDTTTDMWPPCVNNALKGIKDDGRKRCLFVLLNFFKSINLRSEEIKEKINEWNKKNAQPLKEGYVVSQLNWHLRSKVVLPPNCEKIQTMYKDLLICTPDGLCRKVKNPVNYTTVKYLIKTGGSKQKNRKKSSRKKEEGETRVYRGAF
ncbi:hypothetical protein ACFLZZ_02980 [Nanoarchaeota archaeon]